MTNTTPTKLRMAVLGLGRMGLRHASNVAYHVPRAELVAGADAYGPSLAKAKEVLPPGIHLTTSYQEILNMPDIDAVLIATETASHAQLTIDAVKAGKHVLLEKPISISVDAARPVLEVVRKHPEIQVMVGFCRRFDESYQYAARLAHSGELGKTYLIKSASNDTYHPTGFFVQYAKHSGGIWIDAGIHDIDGARWLLDVANPKSLSNPKKQVSYVYASGAIIRHPGLAEHGDVDSAQAIINFENGTSCNIHASRTSMHGHDIFCEVFGTESKLYVNPIPAVNKVQIRDRYGVRNETTMSFLDRFKEAFVNEVNEFVAAVLDSKPMPVTVEDAFQASQIAVALTWSMRHNKPVFFDDEGEPILRD
ncbi:scyllo-inositol 2-dehydrogenase (NAD(+)) [Vanrija pseudolonga]|uniref:Scyllo-inositol 2-dehydrogenase (NAD(+)) n=1 Tax=Vanrija pseudolonga TaxID=143232 RepID=A0AAF0Y166_9TREE|nr:scyllo-inositol 2-dehydrogenase (NAD(+)) [Vanrija pseudolonga]